VCVCAYCLYARAEFSKIFLFFFKKKKEKIENV